MDKIVLARAQAETLTAVTMTYFRILKSDKISDAKVAELLPPALEGLARFAPLINMDTVIDLLEVLKTMLKRVDTLPVDAALNCVLTSLQTLEGPGREMQIDQKEYIAPLYSQLPRLAESGNHAHVPLALRCLSAALLRRREYSQVRVAAFVKRLCYVSLHVPPPASAPTLAFVRQLLGRYPTVRDRLLEDEGDAVACGMYDPESDDPEESNPMAASAWELSTARFHYHPKVAEQAGSAASGTVLRLPAEAPDRIRGGLERDAGEGYIEYRAYGRKHPLRAGGKEKGGGGGGGGKRSRRDRQQRIRFITPRRTANHHLK